MKRTSSITRKTKYYLQNIKDNWKLTLLVFSLVFGLVCGVLITKNATRPFLNKLSFIVENFLDARANQPALRTFFSSLFSTSVYLIAAFFMGMCVCGTPLVPFIPFIRGLGLGLSMGYLYAYQGLKGIAFSALLIVPSAVISSISLIIACHEGMRFSGILFSSTAKDSPPIKLWADMKKYGIRFAACGILLCFGSLVDTLFVSAFSRFFV